LPIQGRLTPGCEVADFDGDNDVDEDGFGVWQSSFAGRNIQAEHSRCTGVLIAL